MSKKLSFFLAILALCCAMPGIAQYNTNQNKVWTFGYNAGVDFTSGSPVAISTGIQTNEGCASVSDASGNLLFYTDGDTIYNRTGAVMPHGSHITTFPFGTASTTQGALIVPVISNPNQYYVFSLESYQVGYGRLEYCIVDMTLAGGMGDVIPSTLSTLLDDSLGEHMIAVQGNNCNVWLVVHLQDSTIFKVYDITTAGISATPRESNVGTLTAYGGYSIGHVMVSPDRTKLVVTSFNDGVYVAHGVGAELYDFDANTGTVSNCIVLDSLDMPYGAEFSQDGSKVYICTNDGWSGPTYLYQFDVSLGTAATILASRYTVNTSSYSTGVFPSLKLACDNKIYLGAMDSVVIGFLDCIPNPNVAGAGCGYTYHAVTLVSGTDFVFGLPNTFMAAGAGTLITQSQSNTFCSSVGSVTLNAPSGYTDDYWNTGATGPSLAVDTTGTYIAFCDSGCTLLVDTFKETVNEYVLTTHSVDSAFCFPGVFMLNAPGSYGLNTWQNGTTSSVFNVTAPGVYYVDGSSYCADNVDTFHVGQDSLVISLGGPDTTVCLNDLMISPVHGPGVSYLWQDGNTDSFYYADHTGQFTLTVHDYGCVASASLNVTFTYLSQNIPDTFVCKGVPFSYTMTCTVPDGGSVLWNDGVTSPVRTVTDSGTWWVYVSQGACEILDTVHVVTGYCNCWLDMPSAFTPNGDGKNDIFRPTIEPGCPVSGYYFEIYNRWGQQVFSSNVPGAGWDGTYKNVPCDIDTYMYFLTYFSGVNNTPVTNSGSVTLIR